MDRRRFMGGLLAAAGIAALGPLAAAAEPKLFQPEVRWRFSKHPYDPFQERIFHLMEEILDETKFDPPPAQYAFCVQYYDRNADGTIDETFWVEWQTVKTLRGIPIFFDRRVPGLYQPFRITLWRMDEPALKSHSAGPYRINEMCDDSIWPLSVPGPTEIATRRRSFDEGSEWS